MLKSVIAFGVTAAMFAISGCDSQCGDPKGACPSLPVGAPAQHYDTSACQSACGPRAAYCSQDVGFTIDVPAGCTRINYDCVPVGSAGANCTVYFCCDPSDAGTD